MSLYILDTDHVTLFQKAHSQVVQRVTELEPESLAVTIITVEEQLRGWFKAIRQAQSSSQLVWAYAGLHAAVDFFTAVHVLDFDEAASTRYEALRRRKVRIGTQDLRIAAIALTTGAILVTRNRRDFARVPALEIKDWTT